MRDWRWPRPPLGWWLDRGLSGGVVAGLVLGLFEVVVLGPETAPRLVGAILVADALDPSSPLLGAAVTGVALHVLLAAAFGAFFAAVMSSGEMSPSTRVLVLAGGLYGLVLWAVDFYVVATLAGWDWFPAITDPLNQAVAHGVFFGGVLGLYVDRALEARRALEAANERRMAGGRR